MIEYLYDAIRASAGQPIIITADIQNNGAPLTEGCGLILYSDSEMLCRVEGVYDSEMWSFTIPAEITEGLKGRYWYCICYDNTSLSFKEPIYLM